METRFTPGPWKAFVDGPFLCGGDGRSVEAITEDGKEVRREICTGMLDTGDGDDDEGNPDLQEDIANLRLIAAAPKLFALLDEALTWIENGDWSNGITDQHGQGDEGRYKASKFVDRINAALVEASRES